MSYINEKYIRKFRNALLCPPMTLHLVTAMQKAGSKCLMFLCSYVMRGASRKWSVPFTLDVFLFSSDANSTNQGSLLQTGNTASWNFGFTQTKNLCWVDIPLLIFKVNSYKVYVFVLS